MDREVNQIEKSKDPGFYKFNIFELYLWSMV